MKEEREENLKLLKEQFLDAFLDAFNEYKQNPTIENQEKTETLFSRYKIFNPGASIDHLFIKKRKNKNTKKEV